eukprot:NODE_2212_length_606_cov_814.951526_g1711_i1.p1 GENE.NODE_2212_length_606_cov_814.951526_g1711_i1~~NODE_2212_length_606_cov_814.951526_g1711_i1.p1  ORF type:complete len:132 (+),score=30.42 NODE_2212_length_606_cov_814.951526_g1711_i1:67-462(+)
MLAKIIILAMLCTSMAFLHSSDDDDNSGATCLLNVYNCIPAGTCKTNVGPSLINFRSNTDCGCWNTVVNCYRTDGNGCRYADRDESTCNARRPVNCAVPIDCSVFRDRDSAAKNSVMVVLPLLALVWAMFA